MRLLLLLLLTACALTTRATQVTYWSTDFTEQALTNRVTLMPWPAAQNVTVYTNAATNKFVGGIPRYLFPDTNGYATTNLLPNTYRLKIDEIETGVLLAVPFSTNTLNLADLVSSGAGVFTYTNPANFKVAAMQADTPGYLSNKIQAVGSLTLTWSNGAGGLVATLSNAAPGSTYISTNYALALLQGSNAMNLTNFNHGAITTAIGGGIYISTNYALGLLSLSNAANLTNFTQAALTNALGTVYQATNAALDLLIASNAVNLTNFTVGAVTFSLTNGSSIWRLLHQGNATNLTNFQTGPLTLSLTNNDGRWLMLYSSNAIGLTNFSTNSVYVGASNHFLKIPSNLADLASVPTARTNLVLDGASHALTSNTINFNTAAKFTRTHTSNENYAIINSPTREQVSFLMKNTNAAVTFTGVVFPSDVTVPTNGLCVVIISRYGTNLFGTVGETNFPYATGF